MKKAVSALTIAIICTTVSYKSFAQKSFTGTVKVETKYEGDIDPLKHIPSEAVYTIFENKMRTSALNGMQQVIQDGDALTVTVLFDLSGYGMGRIGTVVDKEAIEKQLSKVKFSYEARPDTRTICGYECKGYNITLAIMDEDDDEEDEMEEIKIVAYTTTAIGKDNNINAFTYPGLSGYPLYTEVEKDGVKTITQAKEVKKGKTKATDFMVPSNYEMFDKEGWEEKMKSLLGGQGNE
jgi:hypothetical protein